MGSRRRCVSCDCGILLESGARGGDVRGTMKNIGAEDFVAMDLGAAALAAIVAGGAAFGQSAGGQGGERQRGAEQESR